MNYHSEIQKRREKRLLELKKINRLPNTNRSIGFNSHFEQKIKTGFLVKTAISLLLLSAVFFVFQINHPFAQNTKSFIQEVLTREYNFSGLNAWYQEKFAGFPAIIPTFNITEKDPQSVEKYGSPLSGPPLEISETQFGIYLTTTQYQPVVAIEKGLVTYVGESKNSGKTIVIKHEAGVESIYALFSSVDIQVNDWVESGQILGLVDQKLYFSIKNQEKYLNPLEVIAFD